MAKKKFTIVPVSQEDHRARLRTIGIQLPGESPIPKNPPPVVGHGPKQSDWEAGRAAGHAPTGNPAKLVKKPKPVTKPKPKPVAKPKPGTKPKPKPGTKPKPNPPKPKPPAGGSTNLKPANTKVNVGKPDKDTSTAKPSGKGDVTVSVEDMARRSVEDAYKPVVEALGKQRTQSDIAYKKNQADANAFQAWRESRTKAMVDSTQAAAAQQQQAQAAAIDQMNQSLAQSAELARARTGSSYGLPGASVNASAMPGGDYVSTIANLMRLDAASQQQYAANQAAAGTERAGAQNLVDAANQSALLRDLAALNQQSTSKYDEAMRDLLLDKGKTTMSAVDSARRTEAQRQAAEQQALLDKATLEYAMGKDAADLQLKYDTLNSNNANKAADREVDLTKTRENIASQQKIARARLGVDQTKAETDRWYKQQQLNLKKTGLDNTAASTLLKAVKSSRDGSRKSWEAQVKKDGKAFSPDVAQRSLVSGIQNSLTEAIAAYPNATRQQLLIALTGAWGVENVNKVKASLKF